MAITQGMTKGALLMLESGAYSDRQTFGPFRVLKDFDRATAVNAFLVEAKARATQAAGALAERVAQGQATSEDDVYYLENPDAFESEEANASNFIPFLTRDGWIEDADNASWWHFDDGYGAIEPYGGAP